MYFVYLIECENQTIYTGITTDVERRFKEHASGKGASYTTMHRPLKVLYTEEHPDRSTATKREHEIKQWTRQRKLKLVANL